MSTPRVPDAVGSYARDLDRALVGPRRVKQELVREARDHLVDATEAYVRAGHDEAHATALARRDFGSVAEVAPGFQTTLAVAASRRAAWLLAATLFAQPFLWDGPVQLAAAPGPAPQHPGFALLDAGVELLGLLLMLGSALALLATGVGNRWRFAGRRTALLTGRFTLAASITMPPLAVCMVTASGLAAAPRMWLAVALLMALPMALTARSSRRCLAACLSAA